MNKKGIILIADDTHETLSLLSNVLKEDGYHVLAADSGELALITVEKVVPDLILLDIRMPGIDGFEVCKRIKLNKNLKDIPIIFLSSAAEVNDRVQGLRIGAVDYIVKPFEETELLARVKTHFDLYQYNRLFKDRTAQELIDKEKSLDLQNRQLLDLNLKLEQSNKEIQSLNEEYITINEELQHAYEQLFDEKVKVLKSEEQLKKAQRTAKVGNWIWYIKENRLWWSDEMYNIFEIDKDTFVGKLDEVIEKAIHPDDRAKVEESNTSVMVHNKPIPVEFRIKTKDGSLKFVLGLADYLICDENGKSKELTGIVKDITEYKLIQNEMERAKEKAEESDRLKSAFLQNISHEIRTPLNAISGFTGMLSKPELSKEKRKSFVSIIQNSSKQLVSIVSDILTISSLETKQEKIKIEQVCINTVLLDLVTIFKQQAQNQNIALYLKHQLTDSQSEIYTDKTKIIQILTNLLTNALKFTHEGTVEFGYTFIEVNEELSQKAELQFYIKDTGIGIQSEMHRKIFERFRQADNSIQTNYGGTGLGLAISKAFVNLLGGKIWVNSEVGKGSTFYFTIPYNPVNEINNMTSPTIQNANFRTVLVAEDDEYNFLFLEELLNQMDLKIIHTKNGKETIDAYKSNSKIDLILMDIKMPIMTGYDAAKIIKELNPLLPIVAQSAYALDHEREKYKGVFDDYLTKPISEDLFIQTIKKYLDFN